MQEDTGGHKGALVFIYLNFGPALHQREFRFQFEALAE